MSHAHSLRYLNELRRRGCRVLTAFVGVFGLLAYYRRSLFAWITSPLTQHFNQPMLATSLSAPLVVPLELAAYAALLLCLPYALCETWAFVRPALYAKERRHLLPLCLFSLLLLTLGLLFGFFVALPLVLGLLTQVTLPYVQLIPEIGNYLTLCGYFLLMFALLFQLPLILWAMLKLGWLTYAQCRVARPYVIVIAFIAGMLLTPPDVFAQILVAIPICLLYEVGLLCSRWTVLPSTLNADSNQQGDQQQCLLPYDD